MNHIYLIGFMGSGKTTIAKHLSGKLNVAYIDIDEEIEKSNNKKIAAIFKEEGEEAFRNYEVEMLNSIRNIPIIATGGGIVEKAVNVHWMKAHGVVIYLHSSFDIISERLQNDSTRPLWKSDQHNKELLCKREKMYKSSADFIINCDNLTIEDIVHEIISIGRYKGILVGEK